MRRDKNGEDKCRFAGRHRRGDRSDRQRNGAKQKFPSSGSRPEADSGASTEEGRGNQAEEGRPGHASSGPLAEKGGEMGCRGGTEEMAGDGFMRGFVLDTSVILKWFSESGESDLDRALQLRQSMLERTVFFVVPDLLFYELANALRHNPNFSKKDVEQALHSVFEIGLEVKSVNEEVMREAISLAFKHDVTVYDAYFLALSIKEGKPFITADYRFMGRVKGFREIIKLSDI